jgi:hypothetical protein
VSKTNLKFVFAVAVLPLLLAACQSSRRLPRMEPESVALSERMHPEIRAEFDKDYIFVIVKGTSAEAMAQACKGLVQVRPEYVRSLELVLRSNDIEFGAGTSKKEVAKKVSDHRRDKDCALLAPQLNIGGYNNNFLEKAR